MSRSVTVSVAGQQIALRTDAKTRYIKELASYLDRKINVARRSGRTQSTHALALLAALQIADELFQLRDAQLRLKRQVRARTAKLLDYIEREAEL